MCDDFIGIPFKDRGANLRECDCFGLVRLFYKDLLKIEIPDPLVTIFTSNGITDKYLEETAKNWDTVNELKKFDVIAMANDPNMPEVVQHFGIYIGDGKMLHTEVKTGSIISDVDLYKYFIKGYHRWRN